jgi:uncharacterized protein (DUF849 family)
MPPVIICCAVNGGIQGKEYNASIPETPEEISEAAHAACKAGASIIHVHARNPETRWKGATRTDTWWEVNRRIRARCPDAIIDNTTGADFYVDMEDRPSCLDARPEVASLNLSPDMSEFTLKARPASFEHPRPEEHIDACIPFTYGQIRAFASAMKSRGIKPELETYHTGSLRLPPAITNRRGSTTGWCTCPASCPSIPPERMELPTNGQRSKPRRGKHWTMLPPSCGLQASISITSSRRRCTCRTWSSGIG